MEISRKELLAINNLRPNKVIDVNCFARSLNAEHPLFSSASKILLSIKSSNLDKYTRAVENLKKEANNLYKFSEEVPYKVTRVSELEFANIMREGFKKTFGRDPSAEELAGGWAQGILEMGRPIKLPQNNIGNIKATSSWVKSGNPFFVKKTGEYTPEGEYYIEEGTKWRAYQSPIDGAAGYWKLIGNRYKRALDWMAAGDPTSATVALGMKGYFTANIKKYSKGVNSLYEEFMNKIAPQMQGLESNAAPPPGPKPEVKDWSKDYSKEEKESILEGSSSPSDQTEDIDMFINQLYSAANDTSNVLVVVKSKNSIEDKIEFARVAAKTLREFVEADVSIHVSGQDVEMQCSAIGSEEKVANAISALCECVAFKMKKSFGSDISPIVLTSLISKYASIDAEKIIRNRRKFIMSRIA